ncbi:hypothetical protein WJR50_08280 [Catalinimonas sp. 4WD22]|uniref:hypothetical protein n=1 Tax=Catalinimonas locisalis TaxID=3133978 RepID=UPI003101357D
MKKVILFMMLLNPAIIYACVCDKLEKHDVNALIKEADFVVIGRAIKNIHHQPETAQFFDSKNQGSNVLFVVDSIVKGKLQKDTIFINQYTQGSCTAIFDFDNQYLIIGNEISEYKKIDTDSNDMVIPITTIKDGSMKISSKVDFDYKFYQSLTDQYNTVSTSDCRTFNVNSQKYESLFK